MGFSDTVTGLVDRFKPSNKLTSFSGIGSGNQGIVSFEEDVSSPPMRLQRTRNPSTITPQLITSFSQMIVSKPMIVFRVTQIFFNFIAMACFASVASFQAKWKVGPCTPHFETPF
jgi:hypothetical protein